MSEITRRSISVQRLRHIYHNCHLQYSHSISSSDTVSRIVHLYMHLGRKLFSEWKFAMGLINIDIGSEKLIMRIIEKMSLPRVTYFTPCASLLASSLARALLVGSEPGSLGRTCDINPACCLPG